MLAIASNFAVMPSNAAQFLNSVMNITSRTPKEDGAHLTLGASLTNAHVLGGHPYCVVKRLWGFVKVRYRGLAKNLARAYTLFGLANLYRMRSAASPVPLTPSMIRMPSTLGWRVPITCAELPWRSVHRFESPSLAIDTVGRPSVAP